MSDPDGLASGEAVTQHPSDEEMAAYLSGALQPGDRASLDAHLADCRDCRNQVIFARGEIGPRAKRRTWLWVSPLAAAAAITIILASSSFRRQSTHDALRASESETSASAAIRVVAPIDGGLITSPPAFVWRSVPGQVLFRFTLTTADGSEVWTAETQDTTVVVPPNVTLGPGAYLWLVDALDAEGQSITSGTRQFRLAR